MKAKFKNSVGVDLLPFSPRVTQLSSVNLLYAMRLFVAILLLLTSFTLRAADFNPFEGPKPIAVFIQTDPWAMVIGADTPRVAVYEDGEVIFLKDSSNTESYHHKKLSETELSDFKKQLAPVAGLKDVKRFYNLAPNVTDQPEAIFYINGGERKLVTTVYGLKTEDTKLPSYTAHADARKPDTLPKELIELHKFLCSIDYSESKEWVPQYLEVMIWPYNNAPEASIIWPKDWPGLDSKRTIKRRENAYSIFLDGTELSKLQKFLGTRKEKGAVEIGGKKCTASFRYVFPGDPLWRKAFEREEK
jgi:hypothetical protein